MFYYLLSKEDFASLYKFGEVRVKIGTAAESDIPRDAVKQIFSASDSFEYAQERLIVSSERGSLESIRMLDIKNIYPLDSISKNLFESQFNPNLIFSEPIFQDIAEDFLKNTVLERTTISGINALRRIFGLETENDEALVMDIIKGKSFLRVYQKYYDVPLDARTPFSMLITYNRYQHYPKDTRGFFFDAADCFMYGYMFQSLPNQEEFLGYNQDVVARYCSNFHALLDSIPANTRFRDVAHIIQDSDQRIKDAIAQVYGSIQFLALYFYAKEKILVDKTISDNGIKVLLYIQKEFPAEFPKLITLLGGFLGYTWVYDRLYEFQDSPFLAVHHSLDDFQPKEPVVQIDPQIVFREEVPSDVSQQNVATENGGEQDSTSIHSDGIKPEKTEAQSETLDTSSRKDISPAEPCIAETEHASLPANSFGFDLDIPSIIQASLKGLRKGRKDAFIKALKEHHDEVLRFAIDNDEVSLRGVYLKLDLGSNPNNNKSDQERQDSFVKACLSLKSPMFNE